MVNGRGGMSVGSVMDVSFYTVKSRLRLGMRSMIEDNG